MHSSIKFALTAGVVIGSVVASTGAHAISITASQDTNGLVGALLAGANTGIVVTGSTLNGHSQIVDLSALFPGLPAAPLTSSGVYTNASGIYGIGSGVVLSTGGVEGIAVDVGGGLPPQTFVAGYSDGPNTVEGNGWAFGGAFPPTGSTTPGVSATSAQEELLDPITGDPVNQIFYDHFDVTELVINFDMLSGFDRVGFKIVFGSEEFPEFVDSDFIDGFGMFLNGVNIAQVGGNPVNIKHPDMTDTVTGTELDGILAPGSNPVLTFGGLVNPTGNTLRFIVADTSDGILDTTVYFSALAGAVVPLPASVWLLGTAAFGLVGRGYATRRQRAADAT
jgi:hypothetical protein